MSTERNDESTAARERRLTAGDVAKAIGIGVQTLHYYEREGLLPPIPRSAAGYRLYDDAAVERVRFIKKAQALGLPLDEINEVLRLAEQGACPCGHVQAALGAKLAEVDARLRELRSFRKELANLVARSAELSTGSDGASICAIVELADPSRRAATVPAPFSRSRRSKR